MIWRYWIVPSGLRSSSAVSSHSDVGSSATVGPEAVEARGGAGQVAQLELAVGGGERVGLQRVRARRCCADQLGERVALELGAQVHARRAGQVVEPVAVLQVGHLVLEDVVERGAEQAAEQVGASRRGRRPTGRRCRGRWWSAVRWLAQAPVLIMKSAASAGTCRVGPRLGSTIACAAARLPASVVAPVMRRVRAVGGDEVDQRLGVLEVLAEVRPSWCRASSWPSLVARRSAGGSRSAAGRPSRGPASC